VNNENLENKDLNSLEAKQARVGPYTTRDFQLDVLGQLEEVRTTTQALQQSVTGLKKNQEQSRLLRFDGRTLVAIGALALSLTVYMLQDARNMSRRDADIETTKARVKTLEGIAEVNTEGRIKAEVELEELREGQVEIKELIRGRESGGKKVSRPEGGN
jgi:hypothetical protein